MSSLFRVVYEFRAEAESEMSVAVGDILVGQGSPQDDWQLASKIDNPDIKGYVPSGYLVELSPSEAAAFQNPLREGKKPIPPTPNISSYGTSSALGLSALNSTAGNSLGMSSIQNTTAAPISGTASFYNSSPKPPMSQSQLGSSTLNASTAAASARRPISTAAAVPAPPMPSTSGDTSFAEAYARHEAYFRQVMAAREEKFRKLEQSIGNTANEISRCQEKNDMLAQKIKDLDSMIEDERRKWKDKLEAERANLLKASAVKAL